MSNGTAVFIIPRYFFCPRHHLNSEGKLGRIFGTNSFPSTEDWYSSWCNGCQKVGQTIFYYFLWCKWSWKINKSGQGDDRSCLLASAKEIIFPAGWISLDWIINLILGKFVYLGLMKINVRRLILCIFRFSPFP